jgi:hypothetical protein
MVAVPSPIWRSKQDWRRDTPPPGSIAAELAKESAARS